MKETTPSLSLCLSKNSCFTLADMSEIKNLIHRGKKVIKAGFLQNTQYPVLN